MKKLLNITWKPVHDSTGYLFSLAKSLSCAVKNSPWAEYADDIVATSGFAFRMWVSADLCPSATSIWDFGKQPVWIENGGIKCDYVGRYWDEENIEEQRRLEAMANIKKSIDNGIPAVAWDICVCEWGLIIGYCDDTQMFMVLGVSGEEKMPYTLLGKRELPLLSVLTVVGTIEKPPEKILKDTMKLAVNHLKGAEWCGDNAGGVYAYPALIRYFEENFNSEISWNMEYFLGTFGSLKYYAWKYFLKMEQTKLAGIYKAVYKAWEEAFQIKTNQDISQAETRKKIADLLKYAYKNEVQAVEIMSKEI